MLKKKKKKKKKRTLVIKFSNNVHFHEFLDALTFSSIINKEFPVIKVGLSMETLALVLIKVKVLDDFEAVKRFN